jgi:thiamine-phosphate pyrophosphorylase
VLEADGVHLRTSDDPQAAYRAAREALGKDGVVGLDAGISRHAAMLLAEAGADYVGFGAPLHLKDRDKARDRREELIAWWAPIFQVPCVAFDVESREEAARLASAGADFIAVTLSAELSASAAGALVGDIARGVQTHGTTP